jgi:hypothetical protein
LTLFEEEVYTLLPMKTIGPKHERGLPLTRPAGATVIAIVNAVGTLITIAFWSLAFLRLPSPRDFSSFPERANIATTYAFMIGDVLWGLPFLLLATVGIWRMRPWGWTAAQMVNVLWWYAVTVVLVRDLYTHTLSPGTLFFLPFALISLWTAVYLWKHRALFWNPMSPN